MGRTHERVVELIWKRADVVRELVGVYQMYGYHPAFGRHSLLYIGKSVHVIERLHQHEGWLRYEQDVQLFCAEVPAEAKELLDEVETLLVFTHAPPYNSQKLNWSPNSWDSDLILRNFGQKEDLLPEISSAYWRKFYEVGGWGEYAEPTKPSIDGSA